MIICDAGEEYVPRRATKYSAGYDFFATEDIVIKAGEWVKVDTKVHFEIGTIRWNQVMLIVPRSSYGFKYGLRLRNTVGVIDADYTDNIGAVLTADEDLVIHKGDKYMQGIIVDYGLALLEVTPTDSRTGGVGSTGR